METRDRSNNYHPLQVVQYYAKKMCKEPKLFFFVQDIRSTVKDKSLVERLLNAITLVVTFGLTWSFGFMLLFPVNVTYEEVMQWLFTVLNVFQV